MTEQQQWNSQQLPKNSVLFKSSKKYPGSQSFQFNFKKEKPSVVDLSAVKAPSSPDFAMTNVTVQQQPLLKKMRGRKNFTANGKRIAG